MPNEKEQCACGRPACDTHCPRCGSFDRYAMARGATQVEMKGVMTEIRRYRCRKCGLLYNDVDRLTCSAPEVLSKERSIATQVIAEVSAKSREERLAWVHAKLRGETPVVKTIIQDESEHTNAFEKELEEKTGDKT